MVGNSFGGGLALALAIRAPERVGRLVLMGSAGVPFRITEGLDAVWGYTPSIANMRALLDIFALDRMFGCIITIMVIAVVLTEGIRWTERTAFPWRIGQSG